MADGDYPSYRAATVGAAVPQGMQAHDPATPSYRFAVTTEKQPSRSSSGAGLGYATSPQQPDPSVPSYRYAVTGPATALRGSQYSINSASAATPTPATPGYFSGYKGSTLGSSIASSMASVSTYPGAVYDAETNTYTVEGWPWRQPEPKRSLYGFTIGLSILSFVCCCWPLSGLALASAFSSDNAWRNGDELTMHTRGKLAVILIMLAAIFGAIMIFCAVIAIRATMASKSDSIFN